MLILEKVQQGQLVGYSGVTGPAAESPHLYFELHQLDEKNVRVAIEDRDPPVCRVDGPGKVACYDSAHDYKSILASLTYPVPCSGTDWQ